MARVTGLGGVFFKARDRATLGKWYREHLGIPVGGPGLGGVRVARPSAT